MTTTNTDRIPSGATVLLPDGSTAIAYPETGRLGTAGAGFCGRYRTMQGRREDTGWTRAQLRLA
jgi:hypothetical protein